MVDFLYKFKDRHPFSNPQKEKEMDVFDRIMRFVDKNNLMPSDKLHKEYEKSQTTKILNEFPCYEYLKEKIGMKRQVYDSLKDRYLSKPDFVFFFDPKLEIQTKVATNIKDAMFIKVGFMKEGEETLLGAGMRIFAHGELHQGYLKGNKGEYFARVFLPNGDCYAGKCKQSKSHGKGEYEYADGRKLIGKWVDDVREGRFKYIDKNGKDSFKFFKKRIEE